MVPARERLLDQLAQVVFEDLRHLGTNETAIAAGTGQHRERLPGVLRFAQHQDSGAVYIQ